MNLKILRKENKKTQLDMAKILNIAQTTYSGYENGINEPPIETLCKLADFYNVSLDQLVNRQFANEFGYLKDVEKDLITAFRQLNQINQVKLIAQLQGMLVAQN